jgi:DNA-binding IscR family transcriptional regulator
MGLTKERALKNVLEWDARCSPPKGAKETTADFERYWNAKYNLLGCKCKDNATMQGIIDKFCDPFYCKTRINGADETIDGIQIEILRLDNNLWSVKNMERLKGFHYLILSLLYFYEEGLNTKRIKEILTNRKSKRKAISDPTLYSVLDDLVKYNYVSCTKGKPNFYQALPIANYAKGYTRIAYTTGLLLINEVITQTEYLIYLYLAMSIQKGTSMTYENIGKDLDIDSKNINKYIKNLVSTGILKIDKKYIESRGIYYNRYT